ncbi:MAG: lysophospholipid acyltransferase family protein [Lapillicoccus sp.]
MIPARRRAPLNTAYKIFAAIVRPFMFIWTKRDWHGWENLPREGGFVVSPNHISNFDPFPVAYFLFHAGTVPYFLGKESVFRIPVIGRLLTASGQIPVYRKSSQAGDAFRAALVGVREGKCIVVFPEGTLTRDPEEWPMIGKSGAARIALETRCPLIPMAHWGANQVMPRYQKGMRLLPRKTMQSTVGPAVDLSDLYDRPLDGATLREATSRLMVAITGLVEELRGAQAPAERWNPRLHGQAETGNYIKDAGGSE